MVIHHQSFSTFAGNPYFISLEEFIKEGLLTKEECDAADMGDNLNYVDYQKLYLNRYPLLHKAYENSDIINNDEFILFCNENEWIQDYALFMAVKDKFGGASWNEWDEDIRLRKPEAMDKYRRELNDEITFYKFLQYHFYLQWSKLKKYANDNGVEIVGDIPIYVAFDSADTWANPELFQLDESNVPSAVPDVHRMVFLRMVSFGKSLYRWEHHRETGFKWWISRLAHCFKLYDVVRIDHFRGFDEYYAIPYGDKNAVNGHWEKGPGMELFRAAENALGKRM